MKRVSMGFINRLMAKYSIGEAFTESEKINCYTKVDDIYVCCNNEFGECFIEEFTHFKSVKLYLTTDTDLQEIYDLEGRTRK